LISLLNAFDSLCVIIRRNERVQSTLHCVAHELNLPADKLLLLLLDQVLLLAVVSDNQFIDILRELFLGVRLERFQALLEEPVARLDVFVA
jgi:hypothetical protein